MEPGALEALARVATRREEPFDDGRIPFRVRIGVTGHLDLEKRDDVELILDVLRGRVRAIQDELLGPGSDPLIRLAVVSQLAEGADRLVVRAVFEEAVARGQEARLEVILPMARGAYARAQRFSPEATAEFEALLDLASWKHEPAPDEPASDASPYRAAGKLMLARCDVLIALWSGDPSRGPGGTAETLLEAAWHGRPCVWIDTDDPTVARDNFTGGSLSGQDFYDVVARAAAAAPPTPPPTEPALEDERVHRARLANDLRAPIRASSARLRRFNNERVGTGLADHVRSQLEAGERYDASWLAASFARATDVADRMHQRFRWVAYPIAVLGAVAAVLLGLSAVKTFEDHDFWKPVAEVAELVCLVGAVGLFLWVRHAQYHSRWLSARVLAERLRSAYHVAPTRIDFRRVATLEHVYIEDSSREWVQRALEEIWDGRPLALQEDRPLDAEELEPVRGFVVRWIDDQIRYHRGQAERHGKLDRRWAPVVLALFLAAAATAVLRLFDIGDALRDGSIVATITLTAIGAGIGAWLTLAQHRALHARYADMEGDLADVLHDIRNADVHELGPASLDAARVISGEGSDWFGTMWFLDVEHP